MPTMVNPRSLALAAANPRLLTSPNADVLLSATTPIFHVNGSGVTTPSIITFNAILIAMEGTVTFSCVGGTLSNIAGNTCALNYETLTGDSATVTATITYRNKEYSDSVEISKVFDGEAGGTGLNNALMYAYQRSVTAPVGTPGEVQYSFPAAGITTTTLANNWKKTIPAGTAPLWITAASASSVGSLDTVTSSEWTEAVIMAQNGVDGVSPALLSLSCTAQSFTYNSTGVETPSNQTITFTAKPINTTGTVTFTCTKYDASGASLGTVTLGGTGNTRTLTVAQFTTSAFRAVVTASIGGLSDTITIVRLADGAAGSGVSAIAGYLTNESVTVPSASDGSSPVLTGVSGNFKVFQGTTDVTAGCTFSIVGTPLVTTAAPAASTGAYSVTAAGSWTSVSLTTSVTFRALHTASGATIDQVLTLTKAPAGLNGTSPAILTLSSTAQAFTHNGTGVATPASQTISFTANLQNTTGTATFTCTKYDSAGASLGTVALGGTGNTRTLTNAQFTTSAFRAVVTATLGALSDTITVVRLADGAAGTGVSALAGYLTNESVNVPTASDGSAAVLTGVNGNFRVFQGTTDVTAGCTFSVVGAVQVTTADPTAATGAYSVTGVGTWPNNSLTTSVTYRALHTASGATIDQVLTITKALAGAQGGNGVNSATITVYRRTTTTAAPAKPSAATTYTFSPPSIAGLNNSWTTTIPAASGGAYLWATTATAASTTATDSIPASEWAAPQMLVQDGAKGDRGNVQVARAIPGTAWSDSEAVLAISGAGYGAPQNRDIVTLYNNSANFSQQKYYDGAAWQVLAAYFPGSVIVDGTVDALKINSRGLDIKDLAGNVILRAGSSLAEQTSINPNLAPRLTSWPSGGRYNGATLVIDTADTRSRNGEMIYLPSGTVYIAAETDYLRIPQNAWYTVSFDAHADTAVNRFVVADLAGQNVDTPGATFLVTTVSTRFSFTERITHVDAPLARLKIYNSGDGSPVRIYNVKVELGKVATAWCDNVITPGNVGQYVMPLSITNTQFGGDLWGSLWNGIVGPGGAGWLLQRNGDIYLNNLRARGSLMGGSYTGWGWPENNAGGYYIGAEGALFGNWNNGNGKWFQVYANGDVSSTNFSITGGVPTFANGKVINSDLDAPNVAPIGAIYSTGGAGARSVTRTASVSGGKGPLRYMWRYESLPGMTGVSISGPIDGATVTVSCAGKAAGSESSGTLYLTVLASNGLSDTEMCAVEFIY